MHRAAQERQPWRCLNDTLKAERGSLLGQGSYFCLLASLYKYSKTIFIHRENSCITQKSTDPQFILYFVPSAVHHTGVCRKIFASPASKTSLLQQSCCSQQEFSPFGSKEQSLPAERKDSEGRILVALQESEQELASGCGSAAA